MTSLEQWAFLKSTYHSPDNFQQIHPLVRCVPSPLQRSKIDVDLYRCADTDPRLLVCDQSSGPSLYPLQIIPNGNHQHLPELKFENERIGVVPRTYDIYLIITRHQCSNSSAPRWFLWIRFQKVGFSEMMDSRWKLTRDKIFVNPHKRFLECDFPVSFLVRLFSN